MDLPKSPRNSFYIPSSSRERGALVYYQTHIVRWNEHAVAFYFGGPDTDTLSTRRRMADLYSEIGCGQCKVSRLSGKKGVRRQVTIQIPKPVYCKSIRYSTLDVDAAVYPRHVAWVLEAAAATDPGVRKAAEAMNGGGLDGVEDLGNALIDADMDGTAHMLLSYAKCARLLGLPDGRVCSLNFTIAS